MKTKHRSDSAGATKSLKATLIEASETIIETQGLNALTLRAAARASGVSHMAPYRHFDDKDALLAAVAGKGFLELANRMKDAASGQSDPVERLLQIGVAYVYFAHCHPGLFRLMFSAGIEDRARFSELTAAGDLAFAVCANAVADCYSGDNTPPETILHLRALAEWSLVHGLSTLLIDDHVDLPRADPEELQQMIGAILRESQF